jgi:hypothetical protein
MTTITGPELVVLRGGVTVPLDAVRLLLDLEQRGVDLHVDEDGAVVCRPGRLLTRDDREFIKMHRDGLKALLLYCERIH